MLFGTPTSRRSILFSIAAVLVDCRIASAGPAPSAFSFEDRLEELLKLAPNTHIICQTEFCGIDQNVEIRSLLRELACRARQFCSQHPHPRPSDLVAAIENAIEADFLEGQTCSVDGWLLSRTEALICLISGRVLELRRSQLNSETSS